MSMTDPGSKQVVKDRGSYVTTHGEQPDGSWKAFADIATSEIAPCCTAQSAAPKAP
jgi:hypothetical protein